MGLVLEHGPPPPFQFLSSAGSNSVYDTLRGDHRAERVFSLAVSFGRWVASSARFEPHRLVGVSRSEGSGKRPDFQELGNAAQRGDRGISGDYRGASIGSALRT